MESCRTTADAAKTGRAPEVYAVVRGSHGARADAVDECGRGIARGIARGEGGRGEGWGIVGRDGGSG